jgi:hypothetical protein
VLPLELELRLQEGRYCAPLRIPLALNVERGARGLRPGELAYCPRHHALCIGLPQEGVLRAPQAGDREMDLLWDPVGRIEGDLSALTRLGDPIRATLRVRDTGTYTRAS